MARLGLIAVLVSALWLAGCDNPRTRDAHLIAPPPAAVSAQPTEQGQLIAGAGEADYVEQVAAARLAYRQALLSLWTYYRSVGNFTKAQWASNELRTLDQMVQYTYLAPAETAPATLRARDIIDAADELYKLGESLYRQAGGGIVIVDQAKLRQALQYFNRVIAEYPTSDKIDDAAYYAGRIYEHLKNYELAAVYYQRAFQWNENTPYPARFRAAFVLDQHLKMRADALVLYQQAVEKEARYVNNMDFARLRIAELSKPQAELEKAADNVSQ